MFENILCPIDGSSHAGKALTIAIDLAEKYGAKLTVLHVLMRSANPEAVLRFAEIEGLSRTVEPEAKRLMDVDSRVEVGRLRDVTPIASSVLVDIGEHFLREAEIQAKVRGINELSTILVDGDPARKVIEHAKSGSVDCIVMGNRGLGDVEALIFGSVSGKVNNLAPCSVITVK
jgi:nucleotide-binding universal stress UspA family protein